MCVDVPTHRREDCVCRISSHCMLPLPSKYATHLTRREPLKRCLLFPEDLKVHRCISLDDSRLPSQSCRFDLSPPVSRRGKSWTRVGVARHPCCSWGSQSRWLWLHRWQRWLPVWCFSAYLSIRKIECNLKRYHEGSMFSSCIREVGIQVCKSERSKVHNTEIGLQGLSHRHPLNEIALL